MKENLSNTLRKKKKSQKLLKDTQTQAINTLSWELMFTSYLKK